MGKRQTKPAIAPIAAAVAATTATPPEHVIAVAKRAGASDKVAASVDHTKALLEISTKEAGLITAQINLMGDRAECWQKVAQLAESDIKVLDRYPRMVKTALVLGWKDAVTGEGIKLVDGLLPSKDTWPQDLQDLYERHISKRVSETNRVMTNLAKHYTDTVAVLGKPIGVNQKLAQLERVSPKGAGSKPKGAKLPEGPQVPDTGADNKGEATTAGILKQMNGLSAAQLVNVAQGIYHQGKQRNEYQGDKAKGVNPGFARAFMTFVEEIGLAFQKYENSIAKAGDANEQQLAAAKK